MSLKAKLIIVSVCLIVTTVALAGLLGYRESKGKLKELARELLVAKTDQAFSLCAHQYKTSLRPSEDLKREIAELSVAENGYIAVLSDADGPRHGVLVIHPSDAGKSLYNENFPHIMKILDTIDANGRVNGDSGFSYYRQGTSARGRQGQKKIGYYKYFAPWNWVILATGYENDVYSSREELKRTVYQIIGLVMLLGVLVVYFWIRHMFKPVQQLTEITKEVAAGNWDISIEHDANDEIGVLAKAFNQMVRSLRENARIWHEFNVARDMQAQMLPARPPDIPGLSIGAKSTPTREVGGDFYDFLALQDGHCGVVVGDVSGHGVSAAMVMTAAMSAVRFAAEEKKRTDEVLNKVNARLSKDMQNHMFVALFYAIYEPETRLLHYTNAGQTMPFLLRAGETSFLPQAEESDRFPLGIVQSARYEQLTIALQPGDKLIFYTDGIVDAVNGTSESYGFHRFAESIKRHAALKPSLLTENLISDMTDYSGKPGIRDDVTLVIIGIG